MSKKRDFMDYLFTVVFMVTAFMLGAILVGTTPTYELGRESLILIEQCELSIPREEFCELVAKPKGNNYE